MRSVVLALTALVAAVAAPPAAADSLVFIRDHNVWLANADASGQYQVTRDGTSGAPYESPSQADDGTIVAIRETPGARRQIYRMTQSGGLLNPPVNTPAPGTGAIDAKVSPDGRLVAYWFVTTVNDPICVFCVNVASRALISHVERFTGAEEQGLTPETGALPSWMSNDTVLLSNGNATQWYYRLGAVEGEEWWDDPDTFPNMFQSLTDSEAARTGDRVAVVRGDNEETLYVYRMNGTPPATPTPMCGYEGPTGGKFVGPTWSNDGRTLAWQEGDGIWSAPIPTPADCGDGTLRIPGATQPDFGPAPVNPGPRPSCGNPGNPTCPATTTPPPPPPVCCAPPPVDPAAALRAAATRQAAALGRTKIRDLLRRGRASVAFTAPGPGTLTVTLTDTARRPTVLAGGRRAFSAAGSGAATLKLTSKGKRLLKRARKLKATLKLTFTPSGGRAITATGRVTLKH